MKEVTVKLKNRSKYEGTYKTYQLGEADCPTITDRSVAGVGDWIADDNGVVAQVLQSGCYLFRKARRIDVLTCFGRDIIRMEFKKNTMVTRLNFSRQRVIFSQIAGVRNTLNEFEKNFLRFCVTYSDKDVAYGLASGKTKFFPRTPYWLYRRLLGREEGRLFMEELLRDEAQKRNLDKPTFYLDKLVDSVEEGVKNDLHLRILRILANAGGNPEVIKMLQEDEDLGRLPPSLFPTDPRLEKATETPYKELSQKEELKT